jgi:hypothetical protein
MLKPAFIKGYHPAQIAFGELSRRLQDSTFQKKKYKNDRLFEQTISFCGKMCYY